MAPPMPEPGPVATRRQQWTGAIAIAVSMLLLAVVAPWAGDELSGQHIGAGDTLTANDTVSLTVAEGWSLGDGGGLFTLIENGDTTLTLVPAGSVAEFGTAEETIATDLAALEADPANEWSIGEVQTSTTDAGDTALNVVSSSEASVQEIWVISDGTSVVTLLVISTPDDHDRVAASIAQMARSVRILGEGL
ncbi:hypothetical protein [Demequina lignilytica]|uniref:Uncharacterized protein n=1 Tax=Demequina lignilytica TaxID=3051663 RepID=A0AAW7M462_9MICO|nr:MULTISPECIES: hypothetical protein [unclassified Demequina]MDN4478722.1 hypothetical protein [Demequina sp. SYSU T00039-1]MDN4483272.1 hypothetical protein [Demequina sp. SYSU T0a273]MDN4488699.1 hypothetical protein [Demequina sp. SYSU T00039]